MSISEEKLQLAVRALRELGAKRILLFGSFVESPEGARDIDLAVEGIPLNRLLDADVAICDILQAPLDLVSREEAPDFFEIIKDYGKLLYEER
ncbi:MAG: hypothetical protein FJ279_35865 [Planctomycetes bacterium]|nr:hypothetical protein [Planctomycetota bacterium]